jgi:hypothetical protein
MNAVSCLSKGPNSKDSVCPVSKEGISDMEQSENIWYISSLKYHSGDLALSIPTVPSDGVRVLSR